MNRFGLIAVAALATITASVAAMTAAHADDASKPVSAPIPQQTITGSVTAITGVSMTVRVAQHGPGLTHGPGIHSMLIVAARDFQIDTTHAAYRKADGATLAKPPRIQVGDQVTVMATPWQNGMFRAVTIIPPGPPPAPSAKATH